jgi:hypothetical protein
VDALAEHNMEALRAELALDSAFAQHAPDTDTEADQNSHGEYMDTPLPYDRPDST